MDETQHRDFYPEDFFKLKKEVESMQEDNLNLYNVVCELLGELYDNTELSLDMKHRFQKIYEKL